MSFLKNIVLDLLFPKKCVGCAKEGTWFCDKCLDKIVLVKAPSCPFCNRLTPMGHFCSRCRSRTSLTGVITAAHYKEGPLKEAIHTFKYNRAKDLASDLADILSMRLEQGFPQGRLVLVPVPLHRAKLGERGFNQAEELAKLISKYFDIEIINCLKRNRNTSPQVEKTGMDRRKNVVGAFRLSRNSEKVKSKTVLLVDDVFTTGTTLSECAIELRKASARQVWGLVLAKV